MIPQGSKQTSFVFSRRQVECVGQQGVDVETFFLHSRTNPRAVAGEWRRLRKVLRSFSPDVVHAHYGTVTSLLCAIASQSPLVITFRGSDLVRAREVPRLRAWLGILCSQLSALFAHSIICTGDRLRDRLWWRKKARLSFHRELTWGCSGRHRRPWRSRRLAGRQIKKWFFSTPEGSRFSKGGSWRNRL